MSQALPPAAGLFGIASGSAAAHLAGLPDHSRFTVCFVNREGQTVCLAGEATDEGQAAPHSHQEAQRNQAA